MYLVIRASSLFGIFSSKKHMKIAIASYIKDSYKKNGYYGDYHFKYIKFEPNQPWFDKNGEYHEDIAKAMFSLSTMHDEYYANKVETDWSTGKIIKL